MAKYSLKLKSFFNFSRLSGFLFLAFCSFISCTQNGGGGLGLLGEKPKVTNNVALNLEEAPGADSSCNTISAANGPSTAPQLALAMIESPFVIEAKQFIQSKVKEGIEVVEDNKDKDRPVYNSNISGVGAEHASFDFMINGVKFCKREYKVYAHSSANSEAIIHGKYPDASIDLKSADALQWNESSDKGAGIVINQMMQLGIITNPDKVTDYIVGDKCIYYDKQEKTLIPMWNVAITYDSKPHYALTNEKTVAIVEKSYFEASGQSKVYYKNPPATANITFEIVTLNGLSDGGSLCSARLVTVPPDPNVKAYSAQHQYFYDPSDPRFNETSLYTNANIHADWFMTLPTVQSWPGPQVQIIMDGSSNGLNNTAVYLPGDESTPPSINLGEGDGNQLKQLQIDPDAVSHELGHHVIYRTLKTTSGESLIIHEGLADFFVEAHYQKPCLGELICPSKSTVCISHQCLRSADNKLKLTDTAYQNMLPHQQSQMVSGLMWDVSKIVGITNSAALVYKAIDYFPIDAGFPDLITALMMADKELNKSAYSCKIFQLAVDRGWGEELSQNNVTCGSTSTTSSTSTSGQ